MRRILFPPMVVVLLYCFGAQQFLHLVAQGVYRVLEWAQWPTDASYLIVFMVASLAIALPPALWVMFRVFITPARNAARSVPGTCESKGNNNG